MKGQVMHRRSRGLALVTVVAALTAAACGSSAKTGGSGPSGAATGSAGTRTAIKVGVLTDVTGLAASGEAHIEDGIKAGIEVAKKAGYDITYVVADSATSPTTVLAAAKKLVTQDHVQAVIGASALLFGAAPYLTQQGIPVVGFPQDGPEWLTSENMFSNVGMLDTTKVATTYGKFFKAQ